MYSLPDLPYDFGALEPHYSARLLEPHYATHHQQYVDQANKAIEELTALVERGDTGGSYVGVQHHLAFALAGHLLHSLFWRCMSPEGGGAPEGELAAAIDDTFGSLDILRRHLQMATTSVRGAGWGALVWEPAAARLMVNSIHDHESNLTPGAVPLLVIDGWEHAFYTQYGADKAAYLDGFWHVADWAATARRFERARTAEPVPSAA